MPSSAHKHVFLTRGRAQILEAMSQRGPLPLRGIPAVWPFDAEMVETMVREMAAMGLVEVQRGDALGAEPRYALTANGRGVLATTLLQSQPELAAS